MHIVSPGSIPLIPPSYHKPLSLISSVALGTFAFIKTYQRSFSPLKASMISVMTVALSYVVVHFVLKLLFKDSPVVKLNGEEGSPHNPEGGADDFSLIGNPSSSDLDSKKDGVFPPFRQMLKDGKI